MNHADTAKSPNIERPVVLVALPPWCVDAPPVGIAYISTYLRRKGVKTRVVDFNIELYNAVPEAWRRLWNMNHEAFWNEESKFYKLFKQFEAEFDACAENIANMNPIVVGISVSDPKKRVAIELIRRIKQKNPDLNIILGGPGCATKEERGIFSKLIPDLITGYVIGEGEETFFEVAKELASSEPKLKGLPGFLVSGEDDFVPREQLNLCRLPYPTYEEFDLKKYSGNALTIEMSRGCIGNCTFCLIKSLHKGFRMRTPEQVFSELKHHVEHNGITTFSFCDSLVNGNIEQLSRLCKLIIEAGLKIRWSGQAVPRKEMSLELLEKMKSSGCYRLEYGLETGSNKVLKLMRKIFTAEDAERVIRDTSRAGIDVVLYIIVGYPGEGISEFMETLEFLKRNHKFIRLVRSVNMIYLMHHTELHVNHKKYGIELPKQGDGFEWRAGENTFEVRKERIEITKKLLKELGIAYELDSVSEIEQGKADIKSEGGS